ncbi:hypothetical protein C8R47DRAFT_1213760 [Mycena vitilis]|nr:hypothetical protein C8R47DRAFT_1213760 [Mycena vitilis]
MSSDSPSPPTQHHSLLERTRQLKLNRSARRLDPDRQLQQAERLRRDDAKQVKRAQWKAASARYYENHPEVKEKKRLKMAAQRAARKAARRRWDPPNKTRAAIVPVAEASECSYSVQLQEEVVAVVSLLQLQERQNSSPFPVDLPPSSDPGTSGDERNTHTRAPSWRHLGPDRSS